MVKNWFKDIEINGVLYTVKPSQRKNKKYDVFVSSYIDSEHKFLKYLLSYGDKRYQHYHDAFGFYKNLNHSDIKRRERYFKRHDQTDDVHSAKFWSNNFLW
jgi:hypothetical protein